MPLYFPPYGLWLVSPARSLDENSSLLTKANSTHSNPIVQVFLCYENIKKARTWRAFLIIFVRGETVYQTTEKLPYFH